MNNIETITIYFFLALTYFIGIFINELFAIKSTFFGVKLPYGYDKKEKLIQLKHEYKKNLSLSNLFIILVYIGLTLKVTEIWAVVLGNLFVFIEILIIIVNYSITHKKIILLKDTEKWKFENEQDTVDGENTIMGLIYYDKNNPALFINKGVYGVRPEFNFANPFAKVVLLIIMATVFLLFARSLYNAFVL